MASNGVKRARSSAAICAMTRSLDVSAFVSFVNSAHAAREPSSPAMARAFSAISASASCSAISFARSITDDGIPASFAT